MRRSYGEKSAMQSRMSTVSGKWNGTKNILLPSKKKLNNCLFSASTLNTAVATHLIFSLHQSFYFTAIQISIIKPWNHRLKVPIKIGVFSKCCMRILNFLLFLSVLSIPLSPHCKATHSFFLLLPAKVFGYNAILCYMYLY